MNYLLSLAELYLGKLRTLALANKFERRIKLTGNFPPPFLPPFEVLFMADVKLVEGNNALGPRMSKSGKIKLD